MAFYKPTIRVLRTLTQNMQTAVWTSSRGLIADPGTLPVRTRGCIALDPSGCNDNEGYNMVACESCLFTLEAISKVDRVEPNGIEEGYILVGRAPIYTPLRP